jgi:hypothetical protein
MNLRSRFFFTIFLYMRGGDRVPFFPTILVIPYFYLFEFFFEHLFLTRPFSFYGLTRKTDLGDRPRKLTWKTKLKNWSGKLNWEEVPLFHLECAMKKLLTVAVTAVIGSFVAIAPKVAEAYYGEAWSFTCQWECGEANFEDEYGGYTRHGYAAVYNEALPETEDQAADWAYSDYYLAAGCDAFSTEFSQTVCFDTAYLRGVGGWEEMAHRYWSQSDDELACSVLRDRAYLHNDGSAYSAGWLNRDEALMDMGGCY